MTDAVQERQTSDPAEGAVLSVSTAEEDERLRGLIRAELDRHYALPVARRTLELMVEAAAEPAVGAPGYRIVDRNGETRLRPVEAEPQNKADKSKDKARKKPRQGEAPEPAAPRLPMSLSDLVEELRGRHPDLFGKPPPEPPPPKPPPPPEPHAGVGENVGETVAHVRAAGAKFVETQAALAKSLAVSSAERGRALASAAGETVGSWRQQLDERLKAQSAATPESGGPPGPEATAAAPAAASAPATLSGQASATQPRRDWRGFGRDVAVRMRAGGERVRARLRRNPKPDAAPAGAPSAVPISVPTMREVANDLLRRRLIIAGLGGAAVIAVAFATVVLVRQYADSPPQAGTAQESVAQERSSQQAEAAPAAPNAAPPAQAPPSADPELQPDEQPDEKLRGRNPSDVVGVPEVIDTATLRVSGKLVRLFGVEWVRGGQAEELTKYLAGRTVTCQPAPGSSAYLCSVNGRDLSEVVLFNGGGRASPEATPDLVAAEDRARSERLGVWKR